MSQRDRHVAYHEALARRMDEPLPAAQERALQAHLSSCGPCRAVAQAYLAQRGLLRGLPPAEPPRDLWARTSTALDQAVTGSDGRPRLVALGSLASLGLVLVVAAGAFGVGPFGPQRPGAATPFPVTPQPIAFLTTTGNQITVYRTQVSEVCPAGVSACDGLAPSPDPVLSLDLAAQLAPRDLTLGPHGNLAITAQDAAGDAVYSVLTLPDSQTSGDVTVPGGVPSSAPTGSGSGSASGEPALRTPPAGTPGHATATLTTSTGTPTATATAAPARLVPIMAGVIAAGAPAAWSPDGDTLAFSARPADGSTGPDVYVWHVGDPQVRALTTDHRSYFASWAAGDIVISRLPDVVASPASPTAPAGASGGPAAATAGSPAPIVVATELLDPATGDATAVPLPNAWLPSVDPTGHVVIFWQGDLTLDGPEVEHTAGALYLADWADLTGIVPATPAATASLTASDRVAASPSPSSTSQPTGSPVATPTASTTALTSPTSRLTGPIPATSSPIPATSSTPAASASDGPAASGSVAVPLLLAETGTAVRDWVVHWTTDGQAYGVWTTDLADTDSGSLLVATVAGPVPDPLSPTPALRGFSMSAGRVTWVAPDDGGAAGDLHVVTWGAGGAGGINIRLQGGATLAF